MHAGSTKTIRIAYGVFLALFTVLLGALYLAFAVRIYAGGGESPYSREVVSAALLKLLAPTVCYFVAAVGGFVLSVLFPLPKEKMRVPADTVLKKVRKRVHGEEGRARLLRYDRTRIAAWSAAAVFSAVAAVFCIVYLATAAHFPAKNLAAEAVSLAVNVLPWVGAALLVFCGATAYEGFAARRTLASLLSSRDFSAPQREEKREEKSAPAWTRYALFGTRVAIFVLGAVFLGVGIANGGAHDVLAKAVAICMECIGLG